ncbi:MAG: right-handed parallel beta-helix repeat-containing protein [Gemmatimonadales bacterium]|nr:right-handed parallel beta-helix repeat-containing protein [Gemmatimonadales bacterium]
MIARLLAGLVGAGALLHAGSARAAAPCVRLTRAGTQVQGDVRVCPGRYRIADPSERGVLIAAASGTRIDLAGVTIESGDSVAERYVGIGVASRGVDGVTVLGGTVRGYRVGVRLDGGRNHRVTGIDVSGSRRQRLRSTTQRTDSLDRLDLGTLESVERYGGGVLLRGTVGASVTGVTSRSAQNGIGLIDASNSYLADNNLSDNSGWALHLYRSSHNTVVRNDGSRTRRCPSDRAGCAAAAMLLREGSDSNTVADNDLRRSSIGVLIAGPPRVGRVSVGNLIYRNDASLAGVAAFAARGTWRVTWLDNRADSAAVGFELVRVSASLVRGNTVIGARRVAIEIVHGSETGIEANVLLGAPVGVRVTAPDTGAAPSRGFRIDDNLLGNLEQGIALSGVGGSRLRGNVFDGVGVGLVVDGAGHGTEVTGNVFLRARRWFIDAPDLAAGGNYWATGDAARAAARVRGRVSVLPWKPASAAGY